MTQSANANANAKLIKRLFLICGGAFVFTFSMVPLYRAFCTHVLGTMLETKAASGSEVAGMQLDTDRWVTVEFDTNVNAALKWNFGALQGPIKVHPGEMAEAVFWAQNVSDQAIVGQAIPSVAPSLASQYFSKTECFCFTEQLLAAGELRRMPVRFVVDPALPATVDTLTLSYTFFENDLATERVLKQAREDASTAATVAFN